MKRRILILLMAFTFFFHALMAKVSLREAVSLPTPDIEVAPPASGRTAEEAFSTIEGAVKPGETLSDIFDKNGLDRLDVIAMQRSSEGIYNLGRLSLGHKYAITIDDRNAVCSLNYCIDDDTTLLIANAPDGGFKAEKVPVVYERRVGHIGGEIRDNLVSSMDSLQLALELSDIFAWDIDFTTDLRDGDAFGIVVEELLLDGKVAKYGKILAAEFVNRGDAYRAYRFEAGGEADYYDDQGRSLRRAFLKAPLNFRRISSGFTTRRFHPILRTYRPHLGVDYAASAGTPVSAVGDGTVLFAAYKGANGNLVIVKHPAGYTTYYGHLSRIAKGVHKGAKVRQGQVIGNVGTTGLSTGPHLDYRVKHNNSFVNPLTLKLPSSRSVPKSQAQTFASVRTAMTAELAAIPDMPGQAHLSLRE